MITYDNSLSLKDNYMRFYQDCLGQVGIKHNIPSLARDAYVDLSPDDELEKQRIYLRDNGIKHCRWFLTGWDRVFLHWKETESMNLYLVMRDPKHNTYPKEWGKTFVEEDDDPTIIGYELDPETGEFTEFTCDDSEDDDVIDIESEGVTQQPQPTQPSATEASNSPLVTQSSQQPQPEYQSVEEILSHRDPNRLDVEMCDELRQYIEATATDGVYNKGPANPLYNIELAKSLMNVYEGSDPLTNFEKFMTNVY